MNVEPQDNDGYESPFSSHDCVDFEIDGSEDLTVRPLTGERLKRAMAEREKIAYWESLGYGKQPPKGDAENANPGDEGKSMNAELQTHDSYVSPFSSHDCVDFEIDGPADLTVRPLTGERLKRAMAEREKIAYWESLGYGKKPPKGDATPPS